ncbi:MAG: hypothetical protein M3417_02205 [Actinomycetota bacterium]|nr:hypothetical protein [Actinomycetota bacterium]
MIDALESRDLAVEPLRIGPPYDRLDGAYVASTLHAVALAAAARIADAIDPIEGTESMLDVVGGEFGQWSGHGVAAAWQESAQPTVAERLPIAVEPAR